MINNNGTRYIVATMTNMGRIAYAFRNEIAEAGSLAQVIAADGGKVYIRPIPISEFSIRKDWVENPTNGAEVTLQEDFTDWLLELNSDRMEIIELALKLASIDGNGPAIERLRKELDTLEGDSDIADLPYGKGGM
jgi:hypothetical protein